MKGSKLKAKKNLKISFLLPVLLSLYKPCSPNKDRLLQHGDLLVRELPRVLRRLLRPRGRPLHRLSSPKG